MEQEYLERLELLEMQPTGKKSISIQPTDNHRTSMRQLKDEIKEKIRLS